MNVSFDLTSNFVLGACLMIGPLLLVACVAIGVFRFSPKKAQAIRTAEAETPIVMEEIRRIHIRSPDRFRHDRLDRHPFYVGLHVAAWCYAWCILIGAPVTSNIAALNAGAKMTMALCFVIGSTLVLAGSAMGASIGNLTLLKGIRENMTSSMLADDIRLPYTFGCAGLLAMSVSLGIYATTSFTSTLGSLGGWLTALGAVAATVTLAMLLTRIRRYDRARTALISEAIALIERGHVTD
jgi:hypothetical protein